MVKFASIYIYTVCLHFRLKAPSYQLLLNVASWRRIRSNLDMDNLYCELPNSDKWTTNNSLKTCHIWKKIKNKIIMQLYDNQKRVVANPKIDCQSSKNYEQKHFYGSAKSKVRLPSGEPVTADNWRNRLITSSNKYRFLENWYVSFQHWSYDLCFFS